MRTLGRILILVVLGGLFLTSCAPYYLRWVSAHNNYRCMHAVPYVTWDTSLEDVAEWRATNCAFCKHCTCQGANCDPKYSKQYAENITCWTGTEADVVKNWYSEINNYDYNNPQWTVNTGHFINVVVSTATKVGCYCSSTECVCDYDSYYGTSAAALKTVVLPPVKSDDLCP